MVTRNTVIVLLVGGAVVVATGASGYLALQKNLTELPSQAPTMTSASPPGNAANSTKLPIATSSAVAGNAEIARLRTPQTASPDPSGKSAPILSAKSSAKRPEPSRESAGTRRADTPPVTTTVPARVEPPVVDPLPPPPPPIIEPVSVTAPPKPRFEEITIKEDSVLGIELDTAVSSLTAHVEDKVLARVSRDLTVDGRTAISAGARLEGVVTVVEQGGKFKDRPRLGIRFTSLWLADNTRVPIQTETIFRAGESPTAEASSKIGASAVVGSILGAVIGGKKGAAIGTAAGAAGAAAAVASGDRNSVALPIGTPLTLRLTTPVTVLIERF